MEDLNPVDDYLTNVDPKYKALLQDFCNTVLEIIPDAEKSISYQIPTFKHQGKAVIGFGAYKNHCSIFPFGGGILSHFKDELKDFEQTKGSLHFTLEQPVPKDLISKMIEYKLSANSKKKL